MDVLHRIEQPFISVGIGHHAGIREVLEQDWRADELTILNSLSPRKQREWMASRELLFKLSGLSQKADCLYDDFGKPYLRGDSRHISVSHSELWCAAMVSKDPCGVDIQTYSSTLSRIAERFLTNQDLEQVRQHPRPEALLHVLWGAKECIYKAYGRRKLGFREHIFITSMDCKNLRATGAIDFEGIHLQYEIGFRLLPESAWVYCTQHPVDPVSPGGKL